MTEPNANLDISTLPVYVPVMTIAKYAQAVGVTSETVRGWVKRGYVPTFKTGKRALINIAAQSIELTR